MNKFKLSVLALSLVSTFAIAGQEAFCGEPIWNIEGANVFGTKALLNISKLSDSKSVTQSISSLYKDAGYKEVKLEVFEKEKRIVVKEDLDSSCGCLVGAVEKKSPVAVQEPKQVKEVVAVVPGVWNIKGSKVFEPSAFTEIAKKQGVNEAVAGVVALYKDAGYPVIDINADPKTRTIVIGEPVVVPKGKYASYFKEGKPLNSQDIELAVMKLKTESNLSGEKVSINIGENKGGVIPLTTVATPMSDFQKTGGSWVFNTYGQRYSGPDVLTGYGFYRPGEGQQIEASYSHGFQWRPTAEGGKFENLTLGYKKATSIGVLSANYAHTEYRVGGEMKDLDLTGKIDSLSFKDEYLISKNLIGFGGLTFKNNHQRLGVVNVEETQTYQFMTLGATYVGGKGKLNYNITGELSQGLGGTDKYDPVRIMGSYDPHFTTAKVDLNANYKFDNGMSLSSKFGVQAGSKDTPSAESFFLGGPDRGRAYTTGFASMPEGFYMSNQLNFKPIDKEGKWMPYVGHDYGTGTMATGVKVSAQSVFGGIQYIPNKDFSANLVFSQEIDYKGSNEAPLNKINLVASWNF